MPLASSGDRAIGRPWQSAAQFCVAFVALLFGSATFAQAAQTVVGVSAHFTAAADGQGILVVEAQIDEGFHIYGINQPKGGPIPTAIQLEASNDFTLAGAWMSNPQPKVHFDNVAFNLDLHEHFGAVAFMAPVKFASGTSPQNVSIRGKLAYQACNESSCLPPTKAPFTARLQGPLASASGAAAASPPNHAEQPTTPREPAATPPAAAARPGPYKKSGVNAEVSGSLSSATAAPGQTVQLHLVVAPEQYHYLYAWSPRFEVGGSSRPTLVRFDDAGGLQWGPPQADPAPVGKMLSDGLGDPKLKQVHDRPVTFTADLTVPPDALPGEYHLSGNIAFLVCFDKPGGAKGCQAPTGARFETTLTVGPAAGNTSAPLLFAPASYAAAAPPDNGSTNAIAAAATTEPLPPSPEAPAEGPLNEPQYVKEFFAKVTPAATGADQPLVVQLVLAMLAGFLLNFMPCVLPVIGLKILSFVQQAHGSRRQVFMLNLWYSLGLWAVFMALALLAVTLNLGWGQQFSSLAFNVTLAAVVFAFALSFMGVWEVPIPGFASGSGADALAQREGGIGAFSKGALTTLLATPCTGPFLGPALTWAVSQPAYITLLVFSCVALGMASPYLLIGAFPKLISFLPKPGAWMDTFKHLMGFVLLGAVVFILTFISPVAVVPTVALLMGVWAACWWIGRTPLTETFDKRAAAWIGGLAFAAFIAFFSFGWLEDVMASRFTGEVDRYLAKKKEEEAALASKPKEAKAELAWQPFSRARLVELLKNRQNVFIDFTADWCLTCKTNESVALNTRPTKQFCEEHNVVLLKADKTYDSPEIDQTLIDLGVISRNIPVYAIFNPDRPKQPVVFQGLISSGDVIDAMDRAGVTRASRTAQVSSGPRGNAE